MQPCFITGMPRVGSTLVDKMLSLTSEATICSQPLPLLFVALKSEFLRRRTGSAPAFPLDDMFLATSYPPDALTKFLDEHQISAEAARSIADQMVAYSGQKTKPSDPYFFLRNYEPSSLDVFVRRYLHGLGNGQAQLQGLKEIFCEEYAPYLLDHGWKVVCLLRDPRDIIASLNYGRGKEYGGKPKPLLFNLRTWRKSVAIALALENHPRFLSCRYERFVTAPSESLADMTRFLGLSPIPDTLWRKGIKDQQGKAWRSNSSHASSSCISPTSVGKYREFLSPAVDAFVQACCWPEMRLLGYNLSLRADALEDALARFREDSPLERPQLTEYRWSAARLDEERQRLALLFQGRHQPEFFPFRAAFDRLAMVMDREKTP